MNKHTTPFAVICLFFHFFPWNIHSKRICSHDYPWKIVRILIPGFVIFPGTGDGSGRSCNPSGERVLTSLCGSLRKRFSSPRFRQAACGSHPDCCALPQFFQQYHSQKTGLFSRTNMRSPGMPVTAASRLRVLDETCLLDYNDLLSRKNQFRSSFRPDECEIRRILFPFPWAGHRPSPQLTRILLPGKTERSRITPEPPCHPGFVPPHPDYFCNIALDHLITAYDRNCVLQQRFSESRAERLCCVRSSPQGAVLLWIMRLSAKSHHFSTNPPDPRAQKKVLKSEDFRTFYGCGGRTQTYDLRVTSCSRPNIPLQHNDFLPFLPLFSNYPGGHKSNTSWLVHSLISWYGSAYGSTVISLSVHRDQDPGKWQCFQRALSTLPYLCRGM